MSNKEDDDEDEINEKKVKNEDILSEDELINILDMTPYKERIEHLIGRHYSFLFFDFFDNIWHSKIKNKISAPLTDFLNKANKKEDSFWMLIFKSIKFYSNENVPILIIKYFHLKAEIEFKFIYNESKKYTTNPNKFIEVYLKKMRRINQKKLIKLSGTDRLNMNIFGPPLKRSFIMKSFLSKKTIIRTKKHHHKTNVPGSNNNDEEHSDSSTKEEELKNKKQMRTQIMKQIRQLKINTIKEVERANMIQSKQKKKYGKIKSRFLDVFTKNQQFLNVNNFDNKVYYYCKSNNNNTSKLKWNKFSNYNTYRAFIFNKNKEEFPPSSHRIKNTINNSKISYLYSKEFNYSKKNSKIYSDEKSISNINSNNNNNNIINNNHFFTNTSNSHRIKDNSFRNSFRKNINNCNLKLAGFSTKNKYKIKHNKKISLFNLDLNYKTSAINKYKVFAFSSKKNESIKTSRIKNLDYNHNIRNLKKRAKSGIIRKVIDTKSIVKKLEKKRDSEFLNNLNRNTNKNDYTSKIYELFKKTEYF